MIKELEIQKVSTIDTPELRPYRTLRRPLDHQQQGIFVAEGEKVVHRLLSSGLEIKSLLLTKEHYEKIQPIIKKIKNPDFIVYLADKSLIETIVGYNLHQGIMAIAKVPPELSIKDLVARFKQPFFIVALDNLVNSENVGIIVRNCAAFGVSAILVGETSSSPYLRRAVRNSMGAIFRIPIIHCKNLQGTLVELKTKYHIKIIATHPHQKQSIYSHEFPENICLVFGNEGEGISEKILGVCEHYVMIPMMNDTDSLNVACSSAVFLYEIRKQIEKKKMPILKRESARENDFI